MGDQKLVKWGNRHQVNQILNAFSFPKTPTQVQRELGIKKFNLKPFIKRRLLMCLCPDKSKGRLYISTNKARQILKIPEVRLGKQNFNLIGWIIASPLQRHVALKTLIKYNREMTSEEIRLKSFRLNPCMTRISTKTILKELIKKDLVETKMGKDRRRYYWLNENGKAIEEFLKNLA